MAPSSIKSQYVLRAKSNNCKQIDFAHNSQRFHTERFFFLPERTDYQQMNQLNISNRLIHRAKYSDWNTNPNHKNWLVGGLCIRHETTQTNNNYVSYKMHSLEYSLAFDHSIDKNTICANTTMTDTNYQPIYEYDIINFFGHIGVIKYECGCFGIAFTNTIDWDEISNKIPEITGCNNRLYACQNDNFISLWEIYWNFNHEENHLSTITVIGNIFDNPELIYH